MERALVYSLSRRRFLQAASGAAIGLAHFPGFTRAASFQPHAVAPAAWQALSRSLGDRLLQPNAPDFARLAAPWNLRFTDRLPAGIARCASPDDVRASLLWAQANDVPLAIRSGGHSYAGYSTTSGLLLDLSAMNQITYVETTARARIRGGARNADVYAALRPFDRAITHGRCQGVGVAGLVLGGGIGFSQRLRGLTCDQLVETEIMTASGELLTCNEAEHADLFWACRGGGGGNFGVNVSLTFETFAVDVVTVFRLVWNSRLDTILPAALELLPTTPNRLGCKLLIKAGDTPELELLGQLVGSEDELGALLAPLRRIEAPSDDTVRTLTYWDGQAFLSEDGTPEYGHERSRYFYQPPTAEAARTILDFLRRWPSTHAGADWKMFLAGGKVGEVSPAATAFVHRKAVMLGDVELNWTEEDDEETLARNEAWLNAFHDAMRPFASDECYQNFVDDAETDYLRAYYGANLERLVEIKRRYDPNNVFRFPQSIPLAL